ncbi:GNAT family N-acetyltransferase [Fictibacillus nanhaiensis]|uniref:GNAT family N-acetyltransferase n=1 Tax=Fictibacillus nanhaiensis TaxID=742169 RepID=UPI002E1FAE92|nr:GNAT family N-acetyltransferase [Fictibacillus nanhaiensis]
MYDQLLPLQKRHVKRANEILTNSFIDNPMFIYFFPEPKKRRKILMMTFPIVIQVLQSNGRLYVTSDQVEGLFCVSHHGEKTKMGKLLVAGLTCAIRLPQFLIHVSLIEFMRKVSRLQPANSMLANYKKRYNHFLMVDSVCVDPNHRHQGHMTKMMKAAMTETRKNKTFCLLQTETIQNVKIYQHLGFSLVEEVTSQQIPFSTFVMIYDPYETTVNMKKNQPE